MESNQPENKKQRMSKAATPKSRTAKAAYSKRVGSSSPGKNPFSSKSKGSKANSAKSSNKSKKSDIRGESDSYQDSEDSSSPGEESLAANSPLSSPFPGGWETLLPCDNRKALPVIRERTGRRCILEDTVQFYPAIYQQFISLLGSGVSINVACTCVGWNESTFHNWAYKGACDERDGKDTYFSRLHKDVRRAIASKTADCERAIAESSPTKWLTNGPGRIFGGRWAKVDPNKRLPPPGSSPLSTSGTSLVPVGVDQSPEDVLDASFSVQPSALDEGELDGSDPSQSQGTAVPVRGIPSSSSLALTPQQELEALKVWESIGLIKLDPALSQAFNEQLTQQGEQEAPSA